MIPNCNGIINSSAGGVQLSPYLHGVYVVGRVGHPQAKIVRVVHISDTRGNHIDFTDIPMGHILIHSGDFDKFRFNKHFKKERKRERQLARMNHFFHRQPHPYKIFVPGNEDFTLESISAHEIQERLPDVIYLQDSSCTLFGLTIYGSPWNFVKRKSFARGYALSCRQLQRIWGTIPQETDILVTHMAPWESDELYNQVAHRIKPIVHLFGDDQAGPGIKWKDQILFSNGAMHGAYVSSHDPHHKSTLSTSSYRRTSSGGNGGVGGLFNFRSNKSGACQTQRYTNMHADSSNSDSRPHPIVIDIYVVSDNMDYVRLPRYVPAATENTSRLDNGDQGLPSRNSLDTSRRLIASDTVLMQLTKDDPEEDRPTLEKQVLNNVPQSSSLPPPNNSSFTASHSLSSLRWSPGCSIS